MTSELLALTLAAFALALPVAAEPTQTQTAKVTALWTMALDEWAPLFTCGATNPDSDAFLRKAWSKTRDQALDAMQSADWPAADLDTWRAKSDPDALRLPDDAPFAKVIAYCTKRKDWVERSFRVDVLPIGAEVAKTLKPADSP